MLRPSADTRRSRASNVQRQWKCYKMPFRVCFFRCGAFGSVRGQPYVGAGVAGCAAGVAVTGHPERTLAIHLTLPSAGCRLGKGKFLGHLINTCCVAFSRFRCGAFGGVRGRPYVGGAARAICWRARGAGRMTPPRRPRPPRAPSLNARRARKKCLWRRQFRPFPSPRDFCF